MNDNVRILLNKGVVSTKGANQVQHTRILILAGFTSDETYRNGFFYGLVFFCARAY